MSTPMSAEQLVRAREIAERAAGDKLFVEDCEGSLSVWRESALVGVSRNERGEIVSWAAPSVYRPSGQVVEIDLDSWDPGEDAEDDARRADVRDLVDGRALVPDLLAEVERLRAELANTTVQFTEAAASLAEQVLRSGQRMREHNADREELDRVRAELAARPSRADALRQEAHEIVASCPEHGDGDTCWPECHCPVAEDMLRRVAAEQSKTGGAV